MFIKDCFAIDDKAFNGISFNPSFIDVKFTISPFSNAYLSGGALRDSFNKDPIKDWDIFAGIEDELDIEPKPEHVSTHGTFYSRLKTLGYKLQEEDSKDYPTVEDDALSPITDVATYYNGTATLQVIYLRVPFLEYVQQFNFTCNTMFYSGYYDKFMCPYKSYFYDLCDKTLDTPRGSKNSLEDLYDNHKTKALQEKGYSWSEKIQYRNKTKDADLDFFL